MTLRNWRERVDHLLKRERFLEALSLAWSFHEGTARAVVGLFGDPNKRKGVVADKMTEILFQYADRSLKKCPEQGKIQVMEQHFQDMVPVMVDYCLLLQRTDLLFNQIYSKLGENSVAKGVFLECLEPYILSDRLTGLTPHVMKDLLVHFQDNGMMDSIEACIVHLDITSLDIQQVVQMCWEHHLHDAMIYVYNSGMNDYINPMEKLLQVISPLLRAGKSLSDEKVTMGNKLLVYIRTVEPTCIASTTYPCCCLAGRAYPLGDIPEDLVPLVKNQVFEFLVRLHSVEAAPDEEVYPSIRTLLHFDTREFLNVLALTFEDFKNDKQALEYQQRIVDILLQLPGFSSVCHNGRGKNNGRYLGYQICEFMYEKKHLYDKIIYCYLKDPLRKEDYLLFQFMKCLLDPREGSQNQRLLRLNPDLYELYIELLCRFSPAQVTEFLQTSEHYRMEEAVQITRKHNLHEPLAYLLEKKGDVHGAFLVLLETLKHNLSLLTDGNEGSLVPITGGDDVTTEATEGHSMSAHLGISEADDNAGSEQYDRIHCIAFNYTTHPTGSYSI
ncbi:UNVERIFIED_CONTAM: hypothetical protein FKN15_064524 [Acipenser sinensis]